MGSELKLLLEVSEKELKANLPPDLALAIIKVRKEELNLIPGYDGEYGKVEISLSKGRQQKLF